MIYKRGSLEDEVVVDGTDMRNSGNDEGFERVY